MIEILMDKFTGLRAANGEEWYTERTYTLAAIGQKRRRSTTTNINHQVLGAKHKQHIIAELNY